MHSAAVKTQLGFIKVPPQNVFPGVLTRAMYGLSPASFPPTISKDTPIIQKNKLLHLFLQCKSIFFRLYGQNLGTSGYQTYMRFLDIPFQNHSISTELPFPPTFVAITALKLLGKHPTSS